MKMSPRIAGGVDPTEVRPHRRVSADADTVAKILRWFGHQPALLQDAILANAPDARNLAVGEMLKEAGRDEDRRVRTRGR